MVLSLGNKSFSQFIEFSKNSIKTGIGIAANEGYREIGMGLIYSVGFQREFGKENRWRYNPNLIIGGFLPILVLGVPDVFYRITNLSFNVQHDLLRYKYLSLVVSLGAFFNFSRGLIDIGGYSSPNQLEYFFNFYAGGSGSVAVRINHPFKRIAQEFRILNLQVGNNFYALGYIMYGIDIKLSK